MTAMLHFYKKIPQWKRKCVRVHCHEATSISFFTKVWGEVFTHFHTVAVKYHSSIWNWLFGLPRQIFGDEHALVFALHLSCLFSVSVSLGSACTSHACFSKHLPNHCQGLHHNFYEICTTFGAPLLDPLWNRIRPDTLLQIKDLTNQHIHPAAWNFVHWPMYKCSSGSLVSIMKWIVLKYYWCLVKITFQSSYFLSTEMVMEQTLFSSSSSFPSPPPAKKKLVTLWATRVGSPSTVAQRGCNFVLYEVRLHDETEL
jgi:hypothetical protein